MHDILLIPAEGDPHKLLAPGAPFAFVSGGLVTNGERRPSWMVGWVCGPAANGEVAVSWITSNGTMDFGSLPLDELRLRLAWGGKPVLEGLDRAFRVLPGDHGAGAVSVYVHHIVGLAQDLARRGLGTVVLLDTDGQEVSDD